MTKRHLLFALPLVLVALLLAAPLPVSAHVKWFADFAFTDQPLSLGEALTPTFIGLALFSAVAVGAVVFIDRKINQMAFYQNISQWLEDRRQYSTLALRIGAGMTLLLSWQVDALLVPELPISGAWLGWVQFILVLLLIFPRTVPIAGAGIILLWFVGVIDFGLFYMLDYLLFIGVGVYLILTVARDSQVRALSIPALYFTVGFSLAWLAVEKIIYPEWSQYILQDNPQLALGFPSDFFIVGAAFVEFVLGYLLIIGLLGRPLSLVITLVFFGTTLVFGKTEVIGHTIIHAALIVFVLQGPGIIPAPIDFHRRLNWRVAFGAINFLVILALFTVPYVIGAQLTYEDEMEETLTAAEVEQCADVAPSTTITLADGNEVTCEEVLDYAADELVEEAAALPN